MDLYSYITPKFPCNNVKLELPGGETTILNKWCVHFLHYIFGIEASGFGDPHYRSYDGGGIYHFYLEGLYVLTSVASDDGKTVFQFQGNLGRIPVWRRASITREVAFGVPGAYGYQVN